MKRLALLVVAVVFAFATMAMAANKPAVSTVEEVQSGATKISDADKAAVKDAQKAAKEKRAAKKAGLVKKEKVKAPEAKKGVSAVEEVQSGATKISDEDKALIEAQRKAKKAK